VKKWDRRKNKKKKNHKTAVKKDSSARGGRCRRRRRRSVEKIRIPRSRREITLISTLTSTLAKSLSAEVE